MKDKRELRLHYPTIKWFNFGMFIFYLSKCIYALILSIFKPNVIVFDNALIGIAYVTISFLVYHGFIVWFYPDDPVIPEDMLVHREDIEEGYKPIFMERKVK